MSYLAGIFAAAVTVTAGMGQAVAAERYLDDRSDARALVRSLYNAINRKEYGRAYSYFAEAPADSVESYASGYAETERVDVLTGAPAQEGAAGSIYLTVPVAIEALAANGERTSFAGCYTIRQANPQIPTDDFQPMRIERGRLAPADGELREILPTSCADAPELPATDLVLEKAKAAFAATYGACQSLGADAEDGAAEPQQWTIEFNYDYDATDQPKREARLLRFFCDRGAYNEIFVFYLSDDYGEVVPVQFAAPDLDIRYENDDFEGRVEEVRTIGFTATDRMVNADFDPDTQTLQDRSLWRGLGDASSAGTWIFRNGRFVLVRYDVDASYDGEMNPETVLDYTMAP